MFVAGAVSSCASTYTLSTHMSNNNENGNDPSASREADPSRNSYPTFSETGCCYSPRWIKWYRQQGKITEAQEDILWVISSETYSWDRPVVVMSLTQLAEEADVSKSWLIKQRDDLVSRGLLIAIEADTASNRGEFGYAVPKEAPESDGDSEMEKKARARLDRLEELKGEAPAAQADRKPVEGAKTHRKPDLDGEEAGDGRGKGNWREHVPGA